MTEITLTELAEKIGVSKPAIYNKIDEKEKEKWFVKKGNKFLVNLQGQKTIEERFKSNKSKRNQTKNIENKTISEQEVIDILKQDKDKLYNQLEEYQETISKNQKLLDQQQQLSLQANNRIQQLEQRLLTNNNSHDNFNDKEKEETLNTLKKQAKKIQKLEEQVREDEEINKVWAEDNDRLKEELEKFKSKKWFQFWK